MLPAIEQSTLKECWLRHVGPDMLPQTCCPRHVVLYPAILVSPLRVIPQLITFLPSDRYVISLNSDTVSIGRHSLPLLFRVSLSIPLNTATVNLSQKVSSNDESVLHSGSRPKFLY